jgi:glutaredoxin/glutathione-dependent peroxiredoxin
VARWRKAQAVRLAPVGQCDTTSGAATHDRSKENGIMIRIGDRLPTASFRAVKDGAVAETTSDAFFRGKKVALFGVPGAFTSTCSAKHLPSFHNNAGALKGKGVDEIACVSVNDAAVMRAWSQHSKTEGTVTMLADGNGEFTHALGLDVDMSKNGMGRRSRRYSMLVDDGVVTQFYLEEPGSFAISSGDHLLTMI